MKQMKVSTRLAILVGSMAVLVYSIGELGLFGITDSNEQLAIGVRRPGGPGSRTQRHPCAVVGSATGGERFRGDTGRRSSRLRNRCAHRSEFGQHREEVAGGHAAKPRDAQESALVQAFAAENAKLRNEGFEPALAALRAADPAQVQRVLVQKVRTQFAPTEMALSSW